MKQWIMIAIQVFCLGLVLGCLASVLTGCTQILYEDPAQNITVKVNHLFVNPQYQGFEWVFSENNYVAVNGMSTKNSELLQILKYLHSVGVLVAP